MRFASIDGADYQVISEHFSDGVLWFVTTSGIVVTESDSEVYWY